MATILLTGNSKLMRFNFPRNSVHRLVKSKPFTLRKVWQPLDGIDLGFPVWKNHQIIHSYNRITYTKKPWVISFESILSRTIGTGNSEVKKILRSRLLLNNCKRIIAISDYAKRKFIKFNKDWDCLNDVVNKLEIVHPNININNDRVKAYSIQQNLQLIFIGNDFARKGGIVALRLAKKAKEMSLPITLKIVSRMIYGANVYTDCINENRYKDDLKILNLDNVAVDNNRSNKEVIQMLSESHFQIMPTLDDTYGFRVIEGFSVGTPAITTNVCALPEIVGHDRNGYLLNLELNEDSNWIHLCHRKSKEYWEILDNTYNDLANQALHLILKVFNKPEDYEQLSAGAIAQIRNVHDSQAKSELFDNLYSKIINGVI